jgi:cobalt transporter subunit CbtA
MSVFRNAVFIAALAGLLAGLVMTALQAFATVPLILKAEIYEKAMESHAHAAPAGAAGHDHADGGAGHDHGHGAADGSATPASSADEDEGWSPADGFPRFAFNMLANIVTAIGFGLVLVAISEMTGGLAGWREGLLWGLAGFTAFTLAPGLGLPPELPAMPAADLAQRQMWWFATVGATATGLGLIAFGRSALLAAVAVALIAAPHLVGAPQPVSHESPIPPDLHRQFIVAVTLTNLVFWALLGAVAGAVRVRFFGAATGTARLA